MRIEKQVVVALGALGFLLVLSCAKRPEKELVAAKQAVDSARLASVEEYAPYEFRQATEALSRAETCITEKDWAKAKQYAVIAKKMADSSMVAARIRKEHLKTRAEQLLRKLEAMSDTLRSEINRAEEKRVSRIMVEEAKNQLATLILAVQRLNQDLSQGNYLQAIENIASVEEESSLVISRLKAATATDQTATFRGNL